MLSVSYLGYIYGLNKHTKPPLRSGFDVRCRAYALEVMLAWWELSHATAVATIAVHHVEITSARWTRHKDIVCENFHCLSLRRDIILFHKFKTLFCDRFAVRS